jgi:outer membrane immunogenic protein
MRNARRWAAIGLTVLGAAGGSLVTNQQAVAQQSDSSNSSYNWSGFYGGGNLGGAFGGSDVLSIIPSGVPFFEGQVYPGVVNTATPGIIAAYRSNDLDVNSFTGGVQAGYNVWTGGFLYGLEVDLNFLNAKSSKSTRVLGFNDPQVGQATYTFRNEIDANYIASLRPRVGMLVGPGLLYATGGAAMTTLKYTHNFRGSGGFFTPPPDITESASASETKIGWTLGAGYELPISRGATLRAEYLFTKFGDITSEGNKISPLNGTANPPDFACGVNTGQGAAFFGNANLATPRQCFNHKADLLLHSIRLGLNFKF